MRGPNTSGQSGRIGGAEEGKTRGTGPGNPALGGNSNHDGPAREKVRRGFLLRASDPNSWRRVKDISTGAVVTAIAVLATISMLSFGTALRGAIADFAWGPRVPVASVDADSAATRSAAEIQLRIDRAAPGAIIEVAPGRYRGAIDFGGKALILRSRDGAERTIIEGDGREGDLVTIRVTRGAIQPQLEGFTLRNARGGTSAALRIEDCDPVVARCVIEDNDACGAVLVSSRALLDECVFRRNRAAPFGGGVQSTDGSPVIIACVFEQNHAMTGGGAMYLQGGAPMVVRTRLERNGTSVGAWGGAIYGDACDLTLMDCEILGNGSSDEGAGLFIRGGTATIDRCDFEGNRSRSGWALAAQSSRVHVRTTRFCGPREWNLAGDGIEERDNEYAPGCEPPVAPGE